MTAVRSGDAAAVVELRCETDFVAKADEFVALTDELGALVAAKGEGAVGELSDEVDRLRTTLKENISIGQVHQLVAKPGQVVDTYTHLQAGRGVNAVAVVIEGGERGAGPQHGGAHRLHQAGLPEPRRRPRGRRRGRAGHRGRDQPQRGQAGGGAGQDRRRSHERVVQGPRPAWTSPM